VREKGKIVKKLTATALYKMITSEGTSFPEIRDTVIATFGTPKNWVTEVRSPLQALLNAGKIVRGDDISKEVYFRVA
jgi:exosome complex RNA-binding protein Rrp4